MPWIGKAFAQNKQRCFFKDNVKECTACFIFCVLYEIQTKLSFKIQKKKSFKETNLKKMFKFRRRSNNPVAFPLFFTQRRQNNLNKVRLVAAR